MISALPLWEAIDVRSKAPVGRGGEIPGNGLSRLFMTRSKRRQPSQIGGDDGTSNLIYWSHSPIAIRLIAPAAIRLQVTRGQEEKMPEDTPKYDKQVVLTFLGLKEAEDREHFKPQWEALAAKAKTKSMETTFAICRHHVADDTDRLAGTGLANLKSLTSESRLYLLGHGDHVERKLGGWDYENVILVLKGRLTAVKLINVIGCSLARDKGTEDHKPMSDEWNTTSFASFCGLLHKALKHDLEIETEVRGYVYKTTVMNPTQYNSSLNLKVSMDPGHKYVLPPGLGELAPGIEHKVSFTWVNGEQFRRMAPPKLKKT